MIRLRDVRDSAVRLAEHPATLAALPFVVMGAVVLVILDALGHNFLRPNVASAVHFGMSAAYAGGVLLLARAVLRAAETEQRSLRASEERFRNLTRLSADWFWETDAEHRVSWISGGAQVFSLLGERTVYGLRFWEMRPENS